MGVCDHEDDTRACRPMNGATLVTLHCSIHNGEAQRVRHSGVCQEANQILFITKTDQHEIKIL